MTTEAILDPTERDWLLHEALGSDLMTFVQAAFYEVNPAKAYWTAPHIEVIAEHLERCRRGDLNRLIITLPPRALKSHTVSVAFTAWVLAHHPSREIACASYGQDLADTFARQCRQIMASHWYRQRFATRLDNKAIGELKTTVGGIRLATSVGGVFTGRGADLIVIDDPLKAGDALSAKERTAANEWLDTTVLSRLNHKSDGVIIVVMQRLHQHDLVGHLLEREKDDWTVLSFPAIATEDEEYRIRDTFGSRTFHRKAGDLLNPGVDTRAQLIAMQSSIGTYAFSAQYQQQPAPEGGGVIQKAWLKYYRPDDQSDPFPSIVQSWDTANKTGELNDYCVCTTWGVRRDRYYLLDVFRQKLDFPALKKAVLAQEAKHHPMAIVIEDKASGTQLIQELRGAGMYRVKAYTPRTGSDKRMRLYEQSPRFEAGQVHLPETAIWLSDYVAELCGFPGMRYDDQVDSTTQALDYLQAYSRLLIWEKL